MTDSLSYLICTTCGTQHPTADRAALTTCFICDDPRQFTPASGPSFTTLTTLTTNGAHHNEFHPVPSDPRLTAITTVPPFGIGQRAILVRTPRGNILWDCVSYLDDATAADVAARGGLAAIVISHPHFYGTHAEWAARFRCPVYVAGEDRGWLARRSARQVFIEEGVGEMRVEVDGGDTGARAVKLGGHFPGSMVLLFDGHLLTADTLMMTPAGRSNWAVDALGRPREPPKGTNTFSFMWSIPNMIPLSADEIVRMWGIIRHYDFKSAHGLFPGWDIVDDETLKARVLESMQIQIRAMGYTEHSFLKIAL
ncbi:hypothetical protein BT67DRAFT_416808 [Trichocladium antarcticum]|uniref:Metallo-beta-lactamase domain-containing protein n=1 Tax=Trichocladium antarcticum TaxID=1450529 RepID=A0AAN6UPS3_9PEZI|nr:hypothetical protein BT67DRAFT_416808 [Trichocladium antarcticum]